MLDQGSNDGEVEAADFWGYLPGKVTAHRNERGVGPEGQAPSIPGRLYRPCGRHGPLHLVVVGRDVRKAGLVGPGLTNPGPQVQHLSC